MFFNTRVRFLRYSIIFQTPCTISFRMFVVTSFYQSLQAMSFLCFFNFCSLWYLIFTMRIKPIVLCLEKLAWNDMFKWELVRYTLQSKTKEERVLLWRNYCLFYCLSCCACVLWCRLHGIGAPLWSIRMIQFHVQLTAEEMIFKKKNYLQNIF